MNLLLKIMLFSILGTFAQAETQIDADGVCSPSSALDNTYLGCISCALKKKNKPVDDKFLMMMGLIVRENVKLFEVENPTSPNPKRMSLLANPKVIKKSPAGDVEFSAQAQYQKAVIQLLLASGYCGEGKMPLKNDGTFRNVVSRLQDDQYPNTSEKKDILDEALKELGLKSYNKTKNAFFKMDILDLPYETQQKFYRSNREGALKSKVASLSSIPEMENCLKDIEANYFPKNATIENTYDSCSAMYDSCEIATIPAVEDSNERSRIKRKNGARVGGDWCKSKYAQERPLLKADGFPLAPVVTAKPIPVETNDRVKTSSGTQVDLTKMKKDPATGNYVLPKDAVIEVDGAPANSSPPSK